MNYSALGITALVMAFAIPLSGCGVMAPVTVKAYEGDSRPFADVASVGAGPEDGVEIISANGVNTYLSSPIGGGLRRTIGIHLLPGKHTLHFVYRGDWQRDSSVIRYKEAKKLVEVSVEAGHSYVPKAKVQGAMVFFYLEDKGLGYDQTCLISSRVKPFPENC